MKAIDIQGKEVVVGNKVVCHDYEIGTQASILSIGIVEKITEKRIMIKTENNSMRHLPIGLKNFLIL